MPTDPILVVIGGPTASGKTSLAVQLARIWQTEVISADSRQFYKEIPLGTAAPSEEETSGIAHHFVGHLSVTDSYNVSRFENDVLQLLENLFQKHDRVVMVGGSGLYIDAVCDGIDELPDADQHLRQRMHDCHEREGLEGLQRWLERVDSDYYREVDRQNPIRLMRGIEVFEQTGVAYSVRRTKKPRKRPFNIIKIALNVPREELVERIHQRTDKMLATGWLEEAQNVLPYRSFNALNTVGYKELFQYLDGTLTLVDAVEKIKTQTRRYAKRQMTWLRKDPRWLWLDYNDPHRLDKVVHWVDNLQPDFLG